MTLRRFSLPSTPAARASTGLALLALVGMGIAAANTEALVAGRFTAALEAPPRQTVADAGNKDHTLVSGSEAYWLAGKRRHEMSGGTLEPAAWAAAPLTADLEVGDRITVSSGKTERVLEVVAVAETGIADEAGATAPGTRHVVVTFRDTSAPEGQLVTLSAPADAAPRAGKPARAL